MMSHWTDDQLRAISSRNSNLLVSAAAGSGKTAVLIERIINIVLNEHIDIDRLLVVTFTRAAAAEMRQRATDALLKKLSMSHCDEGYIRRQLDKVNQAFMMTFHSFCIEIIRNHYYLINVEASFKTADQATTLLLQQEAMDELLEEAYEESTPSFLKLVEMYCDDRNDYAIQDMLLDAYEFSRSHPDPVTWLEQQSSKFISEESLHNSDWIKSLKAYSNLVIDSIISATHQALDMAQRPNGPQPYFPMLSTEMEFYLLLKAQMHESIDVMMNLLHNFNFQRLPPCKEVDVNLRETVKNIRSQVKNDIKELKELWFYDTIEAYQEDHARIAEPIKQLVTLINKFELIYHFKKKNRNVLDFHDLEHYALKILSFSEAKKFYRQHFAGIFIDEYQDSNRVQEALIEKIKQDDNLFMVGDAKQSIYRFRLAEPELFMEKHRSFVDSDDAKNKRIDLTKNFRSHPNILEAVNHVFGMIMSDTVGEITYDERVELKAGISLNGLLEDSPVIVNLVETKSLNENMMDHHDDNMFNDVDLLEDWSNQELEAKLLTHQIKELLTQQILDPVTKERRNISYRDIAILLRAPGNQASQFVDVFSRENIPVYADLGTGFYESLEINMVIDVLRVIDNMHNDISLLGVLRSPFGGFSTQELTDIRLMSKKGSYTEAFLLANEESGKIGKKIKDFMRKLELWRITIRKMSLPDFLWWLLSESNFYAFCAAMPGGQQRQANLRILVKKTMEFCKNNDGDLYHFIYYIDRIKYNKKSDYGPAKILNENDDVVRLMSIHKSKGLEFPVVIVAGLGKRFNRKDLQKKMLLHRTLGFGPLYVDPDLRIKRQTLARAAIQEKLKLESLSEEMRILYVAMTRAQQRLVLTGTVKDLQRQVEKWSCSDTEGHRLKATNALDWLGPVWLNHVNGQMIFGSQTTGLETQNEQKNQGLWKFYVWDRAALSGLFHNDIEKSTELNHLLKNIHVNGEHKLYNEFSKRFSWTYPHIDDTETYTKVSVSELIRQSKNKNIHLEHRMFQKLEQKPHFITNKTSLSPAEMGTALHYVMQNIDLKFVSSVIEIKNQIETMQKKEMISEAEAKIIDANQLLTFFHNALGQRLCKAVKQCRELPFVLKNPGDTTTLIQGIIDCCFLEDGDWILVDYKTDRITEDLLMEWSQSHEAQIYLYKRALEKTSNLTVREAYIYSFHLNREIQII